MKAMHKLTWLVILLMLLAGIAQPTGQTQAQAAGFRIVGRNLVDSTGANFIIRGISFPHVWFPDRSAAAFPAMKAAGANTVRVVLGAGRWGPNSASDVATVIQRCKDNRLICVLEVHDTTGFGEDGAATSLASAVNYWRSIQSALTGQEAFVIINIGNEPYGNNNAAGWVTDTRNAITAMRSAGFRHTLMVDAPNWGQDWQFIMRDNAPSLFTSDVDRNTIFSVHMYGVFNTAAEVQDYVASFVSRGLPLVIGEFGHNHSDGDPDEDTIMAQAQANGIGYMGWSWSGNGGGVEYLDMVINFDPAQRSAWGNRFITGANGLSTTSREACVFGGCGPTTPTRTPTRTTVGPTPTPTRTSTPSTPVGGAVNRVRFFPRASFANRMVGGIFQGSNTSTTAGFVNLATITTQPAQGAFTELTFSNGTVYRYIRYLSPNNGFGNVAEVEFYSGTTRLTGTGFGTAGSWQNGGNTFDRALDGNTATFFDGPTGNGIFVGIDTGGTQNPTSTPTRTNTPVGPTATPTRTNTPGGPTNTPVPGTLRVQLRGSGTEDSQQSAFHFRLQNAGASAQSNLSVRVYFTLDGSQPASNYTLEKYWDQSGIATVSGPTQASGSTYYFTVSYGSTSLPAGGAWEFHTSLHLSNWASAFSAANDWWRSTGTLPASFTDWQRVPAFVNGSLAWGATP